MRRCHAGLIVPCLLLAACERSSVPDEQVPPPQSDTALTTEDVQQPAAVPAYPERVLWGDTHLHTDLSRDAFSYGVKLGPEEAYRFARGEEVTATHGTKAKLDRPLDFLVVADHAEGLGAMQLVMQGDERLLADPVIREWKSLLEDGDVRARLGIGRYGRENGWPDILNHPDVRRTTWERLVEVGERFNEPGRFTALLGYEWTSALGGNNRHRVVIFRDGAERVGKLLPFSSDESPDPEDLWAALQNYEDSSGGRALAIPHNGNLSNGLMFRGVDYSGGPIDRAYAESRARWEPVVEVTQIKGDGETHPFLSPDDEFADYHTWDLGNFRGIRKTDDMLEFEYARAALKRGLAIERELGANPYRFGMIGSTDSHTGLATAGEDNFFGKHSAGLEPSPKRWNNPVGSAGGVTVIGWQQAASGYAGVWARENTREAIFDALERREVYATTGPRMTVRFFGGWSFSAEDARTQDIASAGYRKGRPMGSVLPPADDTGTPSFLISAIKDPMHANLDRIQMVKGWIEADGTTREIVYDVVWGDADARKIGDDGRLAPVGNTVDLQTATWEDSIGDPALTTVWTDPDFDPMQAAFYYARVLEIPTPRWVLHDAARYGIDLPEEMPLIHQERAYTSPIWYTPGADKELASP